MAKKPVKPAKAKVKPVKKTAKAALAKKPTKPAKKAAPVKKAAAKPIKKAVKAAPAKPAAKGKGLLKVVGKAIAQAIAPKKASGKAGKPEKPVKSTKAPIPAGKAAKTEAKAGKASPVQEEAVETAEGDELDADAEIVLTDADGRRYCRVKDCDQLAAVDGYCRYHYLALWKKIQVRKKILSEGRLERYIEELTARYPDKFLEILRKDLRSEKEFLSAIQELEIDENAVDNEFEDEAQNYIDEVRGMEPTARDEEDF